MSESGGGLGEGLEGTVSVRLAVSGGRVSAATVAVRRPAAARALAGRTPEEAVRLVPLLFSLCGTAQALAAAGALEAALGIDATPHARARALLVAVETADSHAWQALMDWPKRRGEEPQPKALAPIRTAAQSVSKALYPAGDGLTLGGGSLRPDRDALDEAVARFRERLHSAVFDGPPPSDTTDLGAWATEGATPAARMMRRALAPDMAGFGASGVAPLAGHPPAWFGDRLAASSDFSTAPHQDGAPAHTGPLARQRTHPLVAALLDRHGPGVAAHIAARLVELADLPDRMALLTDGLQAADPVRAEGGPGQGSGAIETARGRLAHWVRLEGGRIAEHRTVAPTEWNFAADGPLARGLTGAAADEALPERAGMLVTALAPCVACAITIDRED
ncbi:nickel-dependent hydrogenase large subunit [Azospirillum sp. sgz302134]